MIRKRKIDSEKLRVMLKDGKSAVDCAKHFGVSKSAISQAAKKYKIKVRKAVTRVVRAPTVVSQDKAVQIVDEGLNTLGQLNKINRNANELLDLVMAWSRGDDVAIRVLESQVKRILVSKVDPDTDEVTEEVIGVKEVKFKDPRELALKAMAEIRNQLSLQLDLYQLLYDAKAGAEFQNEVLEVIGDIDPDARARIVGRLQEKRVIRQSLKYDKPAARVS